MHRNPTPEQSRDEQVASRTEKRLADWRQRLAAGDARATSDLQNVILDRLSADDAKALFVKAATEGCTTIHFEQLVARYMADECEADAIKEVEQIERERDEDFAELDASMITPATGPWRHLARA